MLRVAMQGPRSLSYNPAENAVLITSDVDGGSYELYVVPKDASGRSDTPVSRAVRALCALTVCFAGTGKHACTRRYCRACGSPPATLWVYRIRSLPSLPCWLSGYSHLPTGGHSASNCVDGPGIASEKAHVGVDRAARRRSAAWARRRCSSRATGSRCWTRAAARSRSRTCATRSPRRSRRRRRRPMPSSTPAPGPCCAAPRIRHAPLLPQCRLLDAKTDMTGSLQLIRPARTATPFCRRMRVNGRVPLRGLRTNGASGRCVLALANPLSRLPCQAGQILLMRHLPPICCA